MIVIVIIIIMIIITMIKIIIIVMVIIISMDIRIVVVMVIVIMVVAFSSNCLPLKRGGIKQTECTFITLSAILYYIVWGKKILCKPLCNK